MSTDAHCIKHVCSFKLSPSLHCSQSVLSVNAASHFFFHNKDHNKPRTHLLCLKMTHPWSVLVSAQEHCFASFGDRKLTCARWCAGSIHVYPQIPPVLLVQLNCNTEHHGILLLQLKCNLLCNTCAYSPHHHYTCTTDGLNAEDSLCVTYGRACMHAYTLEPAVLVCHSRIHIIR